MIDIVLQSKQSCPILFNLSIGDSEAPTLVPAPDETMYFVSIDTDCALEPDENEEEEEPKE
jgi:hypothetical protein